MTPRENLLSLLRRQGYESAPASFGLCPALEAQYRERYGDAPYEETFLFPHRGVEGLRLPEREPIDWRQYFPDGVKPGTTFDAWGIGYEPGGEGSYHLQLWRHPMERFDSLEQLQAYPLPDFAQATANHIAEQVQALRARGLAAFGYMAATVWETAWYLRGMEPLMMDMAMEDEKAVFLLDAITERSVLRAEAFARAGVDAIHLGDDIGTQRALMMAPEFYREWLKSRLARVIAAAKAIKPDVLIEYHTCGYVLPLIGDLIEAGVDILHPVQPECMDFAEVHARFGDRLSFSGTLGTQSTMPFGALADVRATVHRNLSIAGPRGGLWCTPTHLLEPEVPWENIEAYVEACKAYRV